MQEIDKAMQIKTAAVILFCSIQASSCLQPFFDKGVFAAGMPRGAVAKNRVGAHSMTETTPLRKAGNCSFVPDMQSNTVENVPPVASNDAPLPVDAERTVQQRLWRAWGDMPTPKARGKELREARKFFDACLEHVFQNGQRRAVVVDVGGGNGYLSWVFLAYRKVSRAIMLDPSFPKSLDGLRKFGFPAMDLDVGSLDAVVGTVEVDLAPLLSRLTAEYGRRNILVVGIHLCSSLTDVLLDQCVAAGVDFAVMPCCHTSPACIDVARIQEHTGARRGAVIDILRMGKLLALGVPTRMALIDAEVTPQNLIIFGVQSDPPEVVLAKESEHELQNVAASEARSLTCACDREQADVPSHAILFERMEDSQSHSLSTADPHHAARHNEAELHRLHDSAESATLGEAAAGDAWLSLEEKLWRAWQGLPLPRAPSKELTKALAFIKACQNLVVPSMQRRRAVLVDVGSGHGLLSWTFLALRKVSRAVLFDTHFPRSLDGLLNSAFPALGLGDDALDVVAGTVEKDLAPLLSRLMHEHDRRDILVVASHLCSPQTDAMISQCVVAGVDFVVMPCCYHSPACLDAAFVGKMLDISPSAVVNIMRMAKLLRQGVPTCMRAISATISPENVMIVGLQKDPPEAVLARESEHAEKQIQEVKKKWGGLYVARRPKKI